MVGHLSCTVLYSKRNCCSRYAEFLLHDVQLEEELESTDEASNTYNAPATWNGKQ